MPTWGEILKELDGTVAVPGGPPNWDLVRRKYVTALHALTGRDTILYYTDWMGSAGKPGTSIVLGDMQGMMEVHKDLKGPGLDLILHSPGGSAEATASMVRYLRTKFTDIRVFVPLAAMSAATMWALAGDGGWSLPPREGDPSTVRSSQAGDRGRPVAIGGMGADPASVWPVPAARVREGRDAGAGPR
jgi:hypothetical protein